MLLRYSLQKNFRDDVRLVAYTDIPKVTVALIGIHGPFGRNHIEF
jgi:hypothetical protein